MGSGRAVARRVALAALASVCACSDHSAWGTLSRPPDEAPAGSGAAKGGAGGGGAAGIKLPGGAAGASGTGRSPRAAPDAATDGADSPSEPAAADAAVDPDAAVPPDQPVPVPEPEPHGCVTDVSAGEHVFACEDISHDVSVPEACLTTQCGLILDVHGGTMSGKMEDNNTNLAALGREHGFVVMQPNAALGLFDASTDDAKVLAFAQELIAVFHLDPDRVHMTGFSQGGYMTWRFICQHSDFLASAAPAAASGAANISVEVDCSFTGSDVPGAELPVLYMHGTRDALVDFANGTAKRDAVIAAWGLGDGEVIAQGDGYTRTRYANPSGTVFEFISHDYASSSVVGIPPLLGIAIEGHCYPGSTDLMPTEPDQLMAFGCEPPTSFIWGEAVLQFFLDHPRR